MYDLRFREYSGEQPIAAEGFSQPTGAKVPHCDQ